ncbi:LLM class F420-dependent oxidoreductase [Rhodococcus erythropolis]
MKYGVSTFLTDESISPIALGTGLEERGIDALFLAEHTHIPTSWQSPSPDFTLAREYYRTVDPFVALGAVAAVTKTLLLGTGIALVAQRDPIITAKEVATLDLISGGRAVFGVGAGWLEDEMRNHGTNPRSRGRLMDERIRAIIKLWTEEEAGFQGEFVNFGPIYSWPKPVQLPHPPIYVGGVSERAFARLAEYGQAWMPIGIPPHELGALMDRMRQVTGTDTPVTVFGASHDRESLDIYAALGVERVLFTLPTLPQDATLRALDEFAGAISTTTQ